jgi:biopolymer transport protein ExbB
MKLIFKIGTSAMLGTLRRGAMLLVAIVGLALPVAALAQETPAPAPAQGFEQTLPLADAQPLAPAGGEAGVEASTLPHDLSPVGMFLQADVVVKAVMVGLALASVLTWAIFLSKSIELFGIRHRTRALSERIAHSRTLVEAETQVARRKDAAALLVQAAAAEVAASPGLPADGIKERVASRFERIESAAGRDMIRGTAILATVGSLSPFIGLFGTVWGIMNSFIGISKANTTNLAIVAPGIAEALFATALGLVAAIPAVLFYNVFARMIAGNKAGIADAAAETMRLVSRDLDRAEARAGSRLQAAE